MAAARRKRPAQPRTGPRVLGYAAQVREGWIAPGGAIVPQLARWTARAALERLALRLQLATGAVAKLYEIRAERVCQDRDVAQQRLAGCALTEEKLQPVSNRALERETARAKADAAKARAREEKRAAKVKAAMEAGRAAARKAAEKRAAREAKAAAKKAAREAKKPAKGSKKKPAKAAPAKGANAAPAKGAKGPQLTRRGDGALPAGAQRVMEAPATTERLHASMHYDPAGGYFDRPGRWFVGSLRYVNAAGKRTADPVFTWTASADAYGARIDSKKTSDAPLEMQRKYRALIIAQQRLIPPAVPHKYAGLKPLPQVRVVAVATTPRDFDDPASGTWSTAILAPLDGGQSRWAADADAVSILSAPQRDGPGMMFLQRSPPLLVFTDSLRRVSALLALRRF